MALCGFRQLEGCRPIWKDRRLAEKMRQLTCLSGAIARRAEAVAGAVASAG